MFLGGIHVRVGNKYFIYHILVVFFEYNIILANRIIEDRYNEAT